MAVLISEAAVLVIVEGPNDCHEDDVGKGPLVIRSKRWQPGYSIDGDCCRMSVSTPRATLHIVQEARAMVHGRSESDAHEGSRPGIWTETKANVCVQEVPWLPWPCSMRSANGS
jgi:hypothetical protein